MVSNWACKKELYLKNNTQPKGDYLYRQYLDPQGVTYDKKHQGLDTVYKPVDIRTHRGFFSERQHLTREKLLMNAVTVALGDYP